MLVTLTDRASGEEIVMTQQSLDDLIESFYNNARYERKDNMLIESHLSSALHWYATRRFNITKRVTS